MTSEDRKIRRKTFGAALAIASVLALFMGPCRTLQQSAFAAAYTFRATSNVNSGDVVVWDAGTPRGVRTTTTPSSDYVAGVAAETVTAGNDCAIRQDGGRVTVNVTGSVDPAVNPWLVTSATTGKAQGISSMENDGIFARAITSDGTPAAGQVYASVNLGFLGYGPSGTDDDIPDTDDWTEADLESSLSDVTDVLTNNDMIGTSFPGSPGEGDLFYHSTYNVQFQYTGSAWAPIRSYGAVTLYVDSGSGSDAAGKGFGSGANAAASIQWLIDNCVPPIIGGDVTIIVTAATYSEALILKPLFPAGAYSVTIQGTLTSVDTGTADADSTTSSLEDDGQGWTPSAHAGQLVIMTSGPASGEERFIRDNDADTLNIAGRFTTDPDTDGTSTFTIYTLGTIISPGAGNTGASLTSASHWGFKYLEFSGGGIGIDLTAGSKNIVVTSCEFDTQTPNDGIQVGQYSQVVVNTGYIHASAMAGVRVTTAYARLDDVYILGCNTSNNPGFSGVKVLNGGTGIFFRAYIDGNNRYGVLNQYNSNIQFAVGSNFSSIVNHDTVGDVGIKSDHGAQAQNVTTQTFNNNDDDTDADAATFASET